MNIEPEEIPAYLRHVAASKTIGGHNIKPVLAQAADEIERLRAAVMRTLEENRHLADGENCTLIHLKRAMIGYQQQEDTK